MVQYVSDTSAAAASVQSHSESTHSTRANRPDLNNVTATNRAHPAFLNKLRSMVDEPATDECICWSRNGESFFVADVSKFSTHVLPRYFKHNRFTSFVRQLNMYGFHKVPHLHQGALVRDDVLVKSSSGDDHSISPHTSQQQPLSNSTSSKAGVSNREEDLEIWEFQNAYFKKNSPELMQYISRKKSAQSANNGKEGGTARGKARVNDMEDEDEEIIGGDWLAAPLPLQQNLITQGSHSPDGTLVRAQDGQWPLALLNQAQRNGINWEALLQTLQNPSFVSGAAASNGQAGLPEDGSQGTSSDSAYVDPSGSSLNMSPLWNTLQAIQRAQSDITRDLHHLSATQARLWQESMENTRRTKKQEEVMNKMVRFLGSVFGVSNNGVNVESVNVESSQFGPGLANTDGQENRDRFGAQQKASGSSGATSTESGTPASAVPPRRRGLMIEGPSEHPPDAAATLPSRGDIIQRFADEGLFEELKSDDPSNDDSNRFSEAASPTSTSNESPKGSATINGKSRFTRLSSPTPSPRSNTGNAASGGDRRLSQQAQQQILHALSTEEGSAWLASLLNQSSGHTPAAAGIRGSPSPSRRQSNSARDDTTPDVATTPGGTFKLDPKALQAFQNAVTASGTANDQQVSLSLPKASWELQKSLNDAVKAQDSINNLIESIKSKDAASADAIAEHSQALAQGIQSLSASADPARWATSPVPTPGMSDGEMDAFLSQFVDDHDNVGHGAGAQSDLAFPEKDPFAFTPQPSMPEAHLEDTGPGQDVALPIRGTPEARIQAISPESSAQSSPGARSLQLEAGSQSEAPKLAKRKADDQPHPPTKTLKS